MIDFRQRFKTDPNAFIDMWAQWKNNIEKVLSQQGALNHISMGFDTEVEQFLMLLKLLLPRTQGRSAVSKRLNFDQAVDKLLVFVKVFLFECFERFNCLILSNFRSLENHYQKH